MKLQTEKDKLRAALRTARRQLSTQTTTAWDKQICALCLEMIDWAKIKNLHCYIAMADWREVDTWPLIKFVWQKYPQILTAAPRILENKRMEAVVISPKTKWGKHVTGIPEPADGEVLPPNFQFDVVFVPTLGFDKDGYRLGSGSGHYDSFLATQPKATLVGLCYQDGLLEKGFEHEPHDIKMHQIITEQQVYKF